MYEWFLCMLQWGTVSYILIQTDFSGFAIDRLNLSRSLLSWCRGLILQPLEHNLIYNITISDFIVHLKLSRIHWEKRLIDLDKAGWDYGNIKMWYVPMWYFLMQKWGEKAYKV